MDATGQIGALADPPVADRPQRRPMRLRSIALAGSSAAWLTIFALTLAVVLGNARDSVREETDSAFRMAIAVATTRLPTSFQRKDMMAEAARTAVDIRGQRHVTAELRDRSGRLVELPPAPAPAYPAPEWVAALLRPAPRSDLIPVTQYPNVLGMLEIRTEPSDEIAETWQDLRVLLPMLATMALVAIGVTMAVTGLVLRRLGLLGTALERMRQGQIDHRAPRMGLAEMDRLTEDVNALAAHLAEERAENRRLQARMMTLAEAERARIASDLHDEIGPQLFALQAALGQAARHDPAPELAETLSAIDRHAAAIRKSARAAIDDLRLSPSEGASLAETFQELLLEFQDMAPEVAFRLEAPADLPEPDEAGQIALYRFVRESVLNALRHAGPHQVTVALSASSDALTAQARDDGSGPVALSGRRGLGQVGMRDRATALGARYLPPHRQGDETITEFGIPLT